MAYQGLKNHTPLMSELLLLADEHGRDVLVVLAKSTHRITQHGILEWAPEQAALCLAGEYLGEPGQSSLKYAPECAFTKTATDVVLIGHAHAPQAKQVTQLDVSLRVGPVSKTVHVSGDRLWKKTRGLFGSSWKMSSPKPFSTLPLVYERAFGGKDVTPAKPEQHAYEYRNLIGTGVIAQHTKLDHDMALPNLEDPRQLIQKITDRPPPAGFGCIAPDWQPRLKYAGTHDAAWQASRMPLLPQDFDPKFFNAAHPDLVAPGFLTGTELVEIVNAVPEGRVSFNLPGNPPGVQLTLTGEGPQSLEVKLDSVIIDTDARTVQMLWRASANVYQRLYDIESVDITPHDAMAAIHTHAA